MATINYPHSRRSHVGRSFYLIMSLVLAGIVIFGFSHTVPGDLAPPGLPGFLLVHAAVFCAWVLLFVAQPALAIRGSLALHRKLGWLGAALAIAMVAMGTWAVLAALWHDTLPFFYAPPLFLVRGVIGLSLFAGLVGAGIANRKRGEWHKRLMMCASVVVIGPGLERALPVPALGAHWWYWVDGLTMILALAGPVMDKVFRGRVHPAYLWGVGAIALGQVGGDILAPSSLALRLVRQVMGH